MICYMGIFEYIDKEQYDNRDNNTGSGGRDGKVSFIRTKK